MLNNFKDKQFLAYNLFVRDIENNCVTHAYLIDENNYSEAYNMVMSFVKAIVCNNHSYDDIKSKDCYLCKRIDDGNYPEIKIISPDGMYIKKQQIIDLQQEFSRTAVEGKKRVYIIRDCEKMRAEAANSMLKFLEEPEDNILAILMTNNINNVLPTIISRCKVVKFNSVVDKGELQESDELELENLALDFISNVEFKGISTIVDVKDLWFSIVAAKERDRMIKVFDIMIDIYYDMLKILNNNMEIKFSRFIDKIRELTNLNDLNKILNKINVLLEYKDSIKFNVNSNLLIDSLIISIGGVTDDSRY